MDFLLIYASTQKMKIHALGAEHIYVARFYAAATRRDGAGGQDSAPHLNSAW